MSDRPPSSFQPGRFLAAVMVIVIGLLLSTLSDNRTESAMIFLASGLVALVMMMDLKSPAIQNPQAVAPIRDALLPSISMHPQFDAFIDTLADPVLVISRNNVKTANSAARKLLGAHIVGEDIRLVVRHPAAADILTQPDTRAPDQPIQLVGIGSRDQRWEMLVRDLQGGERIIHLWDRSGIYAVERMRTDFVANASHELRTPLASIKGFIETLEDDEAGNDPATRARFLNVMFREANRMQKLIDDLISLSRIEAEKFRPPNDQVDLPDLMREVTTIFQQDPSGRGNDIAMTIADDLPPLKGDRAQLSQLLHNLVSNSMKYGQAGTPIKLGLQASRNGALVRLTVSDQGEGIPPEHLPRLTERFYRVDSSRSRAIGGTGLGLSIVKHIVERHRGRLEIDSIQGKGTHITITLPADQTQAKDEERRRLQV